MTKYPYIRAITCPHNSRTIIGIDIFTALQQIYQIGTAAVNPIDYSVNMTIDEVRWGKVGAITMYVELSTLSPFSLETLFTCNYQRKYNYINGKCELVKSV